MKQISRIIVALVILLSGLVLLPRSSLLGGVVHWQQFAGGYGADEHFVYAPQVLVRTTATESTE